jgi:hypothetical protein
VGRWELQEVDGRPLPFVFSNDVAARAEVTANVLTLAADSTFTERFEYRRTVGGIVTDGLATYAGAYSARGDAVTFTYASDGSATSGVLSRNTLTVSSAGFAFAYRKR